MFRELCVSQIQNKCLPQSLNFSSTSEIPPLKSIIDQDTPTHSLNFALNVDGNYNIFLAVHNGLDILEFVTNSIGEVVSKKKSTFDWCYVFNFSNDFAPLPLKLPCSSAPVFKSLLNSFVSDFYSNLLNALSSQQFLNLRLSTISRFLNKRISILEKISRIAENYNFIAKTNEDLIYFLPTIDGEIIDNSAFDLLSPTQLNSIEINSNSIYKQAGSLIQKISKIDEDLNSNLFIIENNLATEIANQCMEALFEMFSEFPEVLKYLNELKDYIILEFLENLSNEKGVSSDLLWKYDVNVLVTHENNLPPVVIGKNLLENFITGSIPMDNDGNCRPEDFLNIKAGLLHLANGGFLVLNSKDIIDYPLAFEGLIYSLKNDVLDFNLTRNYLKNNLINHITPISIPLDIKVIIIGESNYYDIFNYYEPEFHKFFPIKIEFSHEIYYNNENVCEFAKAVKSFVIKESSSDFDVEAVCKVIDYANRLAENQKKLSNDFNVITEILKEATTWAKLENSSNVSALHIEYAIEEREKRQGVWKNKLEQLFLDNIFMIDTCGEKIGQINGMCVMNRYGTVFGSPTRITATTYVGKAGIINIEKESDLSGETHNKGVQIIHGWLGQTYAQKFPLSLCCRICFEQNYSGIDGDSASSTELYCILSSLSECPIRQDIAVTGSVNQRGNIQAVGGINHKIEGFFNLCNKRGLKGTEGVIIPSANVEDLVLNDEVVLAVEKGEFHIYPIVEINEGIEILMSKPADIIHELVLSKLKKFHEFSKI